MPQHSANNVLTCCGTGLDRLAFREFDKLGERDGRQGLLPCPLDLIVQPQLNGSCGRRDNDPGKNPQGVRIDNVQ